MNGSSDGSAPLWALAGRSAGSRSVSRSQLSSADCSRIWLEQDLVHSGQRGVE
jgi:hypothetical protein